MSKLKKFSSSRRQLFHNFNALGVGWSQENQSVLREVGIKHPNGIDVNRSKSRNVQLQYQWSQRRRVILVPEAVEFFAILKQRLDERFKLGIANMSCIFCAQ